ncbi:CopG family transcriptional regulator [Reyranella sp.]|jgi:hypothetical protein|uniref:ribbon-helix-helix domain-containing protein n=1 Tax=Reyranella sp. TaxID=1929291 RepID=UPI002F927548
MAKKAKAGSRPRVSGKTATRRPVRRPGGEETDALVVPVRLAPATVDALDRWAARAGISRPEAMRRLLEAALGGLASYAPIEGPD